MFKMMFERYKHLALNMLVDYVSKNSNKITVVSTEDSDFLTVNVVVSRDLIPVEDYKEISNAIVNLEKITKK